MNILISAYDCNPEYGSDSYIAWSYITNLSKYCKIFVLTKTDNKQDIENYFKVNEFPYKKNIQFIYIDRVQGIERIMYKVSEQFGVLAEYVRWQKPAYEKAKQLMDKQDIDICHHVTLDDFRCVGKLWKLDIPFVFGPAGGGQETPKCLLSYLQNHLKVEYIRKIINCISVRMPNYKKGMEKASRIYSSNDETTKMYKKSIKTKEYSKIQRLTELSISEDYLREREDLNKGTNNKVLIISSGRLMPRKGISLLLDVANEICTSVPYCIEIYGEGEEKDTLQKKVDLLKLNDRVKICGNIPFDKMQQKYKEADIFVLPSLRESTGTAVFEALANKLPVITLNQNGAKYIVEKDAGILVDIKNKQQIIHDMASSITKLIEDSKLRIKLGEKGFEKIYDKYTWEKRAKYMTNIYKEILLEKTNIVGSKKDV